MEIPLPTTSVEKKEKYNLSKILGRTLLYFFFFGVILWPIFFIVNFAGIFLMGFAVMPFSLDFQKFETVVKVISAICMLIPYILVGILYFNVARLFIFKVSGPLHLITLLAIIVPTMVLKVIVLFFLSQISFFSSREPLDFRSVLSFTLLELIVFSSTVIASIYSHKKEILTK